MNKRTFIDQRIERTPQTQRLARNKRKITGIRCQQVDLLLRGLSDLLQPCLQGDCVRHALSNNYPFE